MAAVPPVFGTANLDATANGNFGDTFGTPEKLLEAFAILEDAGCHELDSAASYDDSESGLGAVQATKRFPFGGPRAAAPDFVNAEAARSRERLRGDVDIFYLHSPPDAETSMEEAMQAAHEVFQTGFYKRFGLSNYSAAQVQEAYDICKAKGYLLPSVYQGQYSAIARRPETDLFPTLRKLGMAFYAYSPLAGGFLTKTKQDFLDQKGRFNPSTMVGSIYVPMFGKPAYLDALATWAAIADDEGIPRAELAYRWIAHHSVLRPEFGDRIVFGASSHAQLRQTLKSLSAGPLSQKGARAVEDMWAGLEADAPASSLG